MLGIYLLFWCVWVCVGVVRGVRLGKELLPRPSWQRIPTFAFPGASSSYMTPSEVSEYSSNFSAMLIWGFNASCREGNRVFPAYTDASTYWCPDKAGVNFSEFNPVMQGNLGVQGSALKAVGGAEYPVFGYVESMQSQASYASGQAFLERPSWWLRLEAIGVVDCERDGCNWQGPALRQYDHRQAAVRSFFTETVVRETAGQAGLDGVFLDVVDAWPTGLCERWKCTAEETAALTQAAIQVLDASLLELERLGKSAIVSMHSRPYASPEVYEAMRQVLVTRGNAMRFYEFFGKSNLVADFNAMLNETQSGISLAVHTPKKTLNPDWVELAAFLIAADNSSFFCYSSGWTLQDAWWQPEFGNPIGPPLSPPTLLSSNLPTNPPTNPPTNSPTNPPTLPTLPTLPTSPSNWTTLPATNLVYGGVPRPRSSQPPVFFLGNASSFSRCQALAQASSMPLTMLTFVDADGGEYALQCYGRTDLHFHPVQQASCTSAKSPAVPSGTYVRQFLHANVSFNTDTLEAHIHFFHT